MAELKPYDFLAKCLKCGHKDVKTTYCTERHSMGRNDTIYKTCGEQDNEHFDRTCQRCFYEWAEKCQSSPSAPEPLKQVPSDEKPIRELVKYLRQLYGNNALPYGEALDNLIAEVERRISRIGQPANPSPVTATMWEQAVNELESKLYCSALDATDEYAVANFNDAFSFLRTRLAAAQQVPASARVPIGSWLDEGALDKGLDETLKHVTLGQGRLTRGQLLEKIEVALLGYLQDDEWDTTEVAGAIADVVLTLQGPVKVSREQWEKLFPKGYLSSYHIGEGTFKAWLKYIGMEVEE